MSGEYNLYFRKFGSSLKDQIKIYHETHKNNNSEEEKLHALVAIANGAEKKAAAEVSQASGLLELRGDATDLFEKQAYQTTDSKFSQQQNVSGLKALITKFIKVQNELLTECLKMIKTSQNRPKTSLSETDENIKGSTQQVQHRVNTSSFFNCSLKTS